MFFVDRFRRSVQLPNAHSLALQASVALCLMLLPAGVTLAASAEAVLEEVIVTGSLVDRVGDAGSVTVVDGDALGLLRPTHINETLARVPGAWVSRGSGQEHLTAIRSGVLTGAGACGEFLMLENGVPLRPAGFCNINNLFEVNHEQASSVEVVRGAGGALFGGNAVHGAINVVQKQSKPGASVSAEGGAYDYYQLRGEYGVERNGQQFSLKALSASSNGYRDDTGYSQQKLSILHSGEFGRWSVNNLLSATLLNQETGGFVRGFEVYKDNELQDSNPNPEAFRDAWAVRASSRWQTDLSNGMALAITPYVRRSGMAFLQHFLPGQPLETNDQTSAGVIAELALGGDRWNGRLGATLEYMDGALKEDQDSPTIGSAFLVGTRPEGLHYNYELESVMAAAYYDIDVQINEALSLVHSLRVETLEYDHTNLGLTGNTREDGTACGFGGCLYTRPPSGDDRFTNVAGRLGANYDLGQVFGENAQAFVTFSTGFRPPQGTELYRLQNGQTTTDLDSERLRSLEAGFRAGGLSVALYNDTTRDFIFRDSEGFNVSNGRTRSQGIEVSAEWPLNEQHEFDLVASYARHKYDFTTAAGGNEQIEDGNDVDTAPRWLGSARWRYRPNASLLSELELVGVGKHYINAANTADYDGHVVMNWRASWQAKKQLRVFARVVNLLNEEYAERADFAFGSYRYFPGMPRQLYLGVEYTPQG